MRHVGRCQQIGNHREGPRQGTGRNLLVLMLIEQMLADAGSIHRQQRRDNMRGKEAN